MALGILLAAVVVIVCVWLNSFSQKFGIPMLLAFIVLGMLFGSDGILRIPFENYNFSEQICSVALIFIMFYGGFGTNWSQAKPVAVKAALLSTVGVVLTAGLTGLFCYFVLRFELLESLLVGAVLSSTDAASVFSILRSKKLGLKEHTDSMLELESGSNDPSSYMLTAVLLTVMDGGVRAGSVVWMVVLQFAAGIGVGIAVAWGASFVLRRFRFATAGFDMAFVIGVALLSYSLAAVLGGNGYLSVYLSGILLGNGKLPKKKALVNFFDGITGLMQMLIFFLLGLLSTPSRMLPILLPAVAIMLFLTFFARPAAVFALLSPFRCSIRQQLLVSFAGLRGAASIVFAIMATVSQPELGRDLFHIVFCIVLLSITFQGSFLAPFAKRIGLSDAEKDVMKTFSDYSEDSDLNFIKVQIQKGHPWTDREVRAIVFPPDTLIVMLLRDGERIVPGGRTVLRENDIAILCAYKFHDTGSIGLREQAIPPDSRWIGKSIRDFSPESGELVILIIRGSRTVVPKGNTAIRKGDILVIHSSEPE